MKAASVRELKKELASRSPEELLEICLSLSKFKKENKELLTYLLFEANDEKSYIYTVKDEIDEQFETVNKKAYYLMKKGVRKVLRMVKKYIRYSKKKETEVELLLYFCQKLKEQRPSIANNTVLKNIFQREIDNIGKILLTLHEDLQFDYGERLDDLEK